MRRPLDTPRLFFIPLITESSRGSPLSYFLSLSRTIVPAAVLLLASCPGGAGRPENASGKHQPADPATAAWLSERARQQAQLAARSQVLHDFRFSDNRAASGITFENRIVDDAGKTYKLAHYDHGSGVCAADVDGDRLPDLYFGTQLGANELWKNLGGGRFANATQASGLEMRDAITVACSFADIDNDGDADLFVTTVRKGNRLFENLGDGRFADISQTAGVGYVG